MNIRKAVLLVISLSIILLLVIFGNVLLHPNDYLFGAIEDGTKNYYTAAYFVKYNQGVWFTGMNYPFGEHITYTDNQPLFAVLLNQINQHVIPVSAYTIGIFNSFMLLGIVGCAFFLFLILTEIKLPAWYAIIIAVIIAFLSPQLFRIRNHYALGYTFIIPMFWYLLIRIFRAPKRLKWYIVYAFAVLLAVLIHPYYALISLLLVLAHLVVYYFQEKKFKKLNLTLYLRFLAAAIVPLLLFQAFMHFTDPVTDRPETPYGFTAYRTSFKALFFPLEEPLLKYWQAIFGTKEVIWEGYAYVGQAAFIILILTLIKFYKYGRKKRWKLIFRPVLPAALRTGLWASVLVLLFALAIPIRWGLESALDFVPPLKQFRSIGRFAWIFYYIFSVYAAYYLFQLSRNFRLKHKYLAAKMVLVIPLLFWGFEALNNTYQKAASIKENQVAAEFISDKGNYNELLAQAHTNASAFQAIIPLPYFNVGSEKISIYRNSDISNEVMKASLNTGLPIATSLMSRTSLSQSLAQVQLFSNDNTPKEILARYPSEKPLLLLVADDSLAPAELNLLEKAQPIGKQKKFSLYKLSLDSLKPKVSQTAIPAGLIKQQSFFLSQPNSFVVRKNFSNYAGNGLFEKGAFASGNKETVILDTIVQNSNPTVNYEFSAWAFSKTKKLPEVILEILSPTGQLLSETKLQFNATTEVYNGWLRSSALLKLQAGKVQLKITTKAQQALLDDILLKPEMIDVYFYGRNRNTIIKNNFLVTH